MLVPIRPLQSTEIRRVDEITSRKFLTPRVPSVLTETSEDVRLTIGERARRLAYGQGRTAGSSAHAPSEPDARPSAVHAPPPSAVPRSIADATADVLRAVTLPLAFETDESGDGFGYEPHVRELDVGESDAGSEPFSNRMLRGLTAEPFAGPRVASGESGFPGSNGGFGDLAWSSRIPFEVFQRAVTEATAGADPAGHAWNVAPLEPVFSPPENGGEPFGRAVPFEEEGVAASGAPSLQPESGVVSKLSAAEVEDLIAELSWSLPERQSAYPDTATA